MDRRHFLSSTAAGSGRLAALPGPAQRPGPPKDVLVVANEFGPNSLDIHTVGANRPAYGVSWVCYDRLMTYGRKRLPDGRVVYDRDKLEPELAESWAIAPDGNSVTFKLRKQRHLPRRHAGHGEGRQVELRPRGDGGRLPDLPDEGRLAGEARAVRGRGRPHLPREVHPPRQAHDEQPRRGGALRLQQRAGEEERHRAGPLGPGLDAQQRGRRRCLQGGELALGAGDRLRAQRRLEERPAAQAAPHRAARRAQRRQPPRAADQGRHRHHLRPAAQGLLGARARTAVRSRSRPCRSRTPCSTWA
jgi:hypothetical protein